MLADRKGVGIAAQPRLITPARILVNLVAQHHAHGRAHGSPYEQPDSATDDFSSELHALL